VTTATKKQAWTPALSSLVRKIDINTRAIAKLVSAQQYLNDFAKNEQSIDDLVFALVQDRRNLRCALEDELHRQSSWKK
jgi:homoserine kinase